jgi:glycerol uptake facilitator-like aquaporin
MTSLPSGPHFNPAVTLADASQGGLPWRDVPVYFGAQLGGAFAGVAVAHVMFKEPALFFTSQHERSGASRLVSEFVATFGLLAVIWGCVRRRALFRWLVPTLPEYAPRVIDRLPDAERSEEPT